MTLRLRASATSDVGPHRTVNQDAAFTSTWGAAVADGVGGGPSGDLASAALVHRLVAGGSRVVDADGFAVRVRGANWDLRAQVERDPALKGMATTFTGIMLCPSGLLLAHVGDSRAYLLRAGRFVRETHDDSFVQVLVDNGLISPEEATTHPRRNVITASLGGGENDSVAVASHAPHVGDRWLLCSDGVTDYVPEEEIAAILAGFHRPGDASDAIVRVALEAGTRDNATAVVCDVESGDPTEETTFYGAAANLFREDIESA